MTRETKITAVLVVLLIGALFGGILGLINATRRRPPPGRAEAEDIARAACPGARIRSLGPRAFEAVGCGIREVWRYLPVPKCADYGCDKYWRRVRLLEVKNADR